MKNEPITKNDQSEEDGSFPIQAKLLLAVIGIALLVIILKFMGVV